MAVQDAPAPTVEHEARVSSGWSMLFLALALVVGAVALPFVIVLATGSEALAGVGVVLAPIMIVTALVLLRGTFSLQPNEARVLILFGEYKGTVRTSGYHFANPFYSRNRGKVATLSTGEEHGRQRTGTASATGGFSLPTKISLRVHNFVSDKLKVNDKRGNPVEIAAVVVWRVTDTAQAAFDVDDYESYVYVQSEAAIRVIASLYAYDDGEPGEITLRGGGEQVSEELKKELEVRLAKAGVVVEEARLTHLAYAPEIASAMLRRQQAEAIIAAREKIVLGAVGMVRSALEELSAADVVKLDEERKAAMVSNLLVVLCGTTEASPVINTGTLYA